MTPEQTIIDRYTAKWLGKTHYFTGKPCKRGHIALRPVGSGHCSVCHQEQRIRHRKTRKFKETSKNYYEANKPDISARQKFNKYKIVKSEFEQLIIKQNNCCAICEVTFETPHIDHCHNSGKIRGLLCLNCNNGLGRFKDNVRLLQKAIEYLNGNLS